MFGKRLKKAFLRVKNDIESLKANANEWIIYLNSNQRQIKARLDKVEEKIAKLEKEGYLKIYE